MHFSTAAGNDPTLWRSAFSSNKDWGGSYVLTNQSHPFHLIVTTFLGTTHLKALFVEDDKGRGHFEVEGI